MRKVFRMIWVPDKSKVLTGIAHLSPSNDWGLHKNRNSYVRTLVIVDRAINLSDKLIKSGKNEKWWYLNFKSNCQL